MSRNSFGKGSPRRDAEFHARRHERHMQKLQEGTTLTWDSPQPFVNEEKKARRRAKAEEKHLSEMRDMETFGGW